MVRDVIWSDDFDRQFKKLARRRRQIFDDLRGLLDEFEAGRLPEEAPKAFKECQSKSLE